MNHLASGARRAVSIVLLAFLTSSGCIAVGDGGSNTKVVNPTIGKQLTDLKEAHDKGAINDDEYTSTRAKMLSDVH